MVYWQERAQQVLATGMRAARVAAGIVGTYAFQQLYRLVELLAQIFPDYPIGNRIRGLMLRPFLGSAGKRLCVSVGVRIAAPHNVRVGNDVYIGNGCWLNGVGGGIELCDEVMLGPFVTLVSSDHTFNDGSARFAPGRPGRITVGAGSWLAAKAVVTAGVTVGPSCLVAAGAVVVRDVPAGSIVGGVPARVIGSTGVARSHSEG